MAASACVDLSFLLIPCKELFPILPLFMSCTFSPSICHINLDALERNFKRLGEPSSLMPVIKSDAYGHGLMQVAATLDRAGAVSFAVGTVSEGVALRKAGLAQQIVLLIGCMDKEEWLLAMQHKLTPVIGSFDDLALAAQVCAENEPGILNAAIKCDTGMSRLGFNLDDKSQLLEHLRKTPKIKPALLVSHLACADMPEEDGFTKRQIENYEKFYAAVCSLYPETSHSLGNSAATLGHHATSNDISRPGLALYGGNPFYGTRLEKYGHNQEWVMSLSSPIIHIRELKAGQSISYGRIFTAQRAMRIGIVACGYANGVNRQLSNRMKVLVGGRLASQLGRICMGMFMVDLSQFPEIKTGERVWILGGKPDPGQTAPDAQQIAQMLGTIPYEVLCHMGSLNQRIYGNDTLAY